MVVESQDSSGRQKRKRSWFRLRFGLRTLLVSVALFAVAMSFEAKRAADQAALVARVKELGGRCDIVPRSWMPGFLFRWLDRNQTCTVRAVTITVVHAPSYLWAREKISDSAEVQGLLRLSAMAKVQRLELRGTAVTDDALDELAAMKELKKVVFLHTAVSEDAVEELMEAFPDCAVEYSRNINGPHELNVLHRAILMAEG